MLVDKEYDGYEVRTNSFSAAFCPSSRQANRKEPVACDFHAYKDRNRIERMFNRLKQARRIATRYNKTACSFMTFLDIAAARLWLTNFVNRPSVDIEISEALITGRRRLDVSP